MGVPCMEGQVTTRGGSEAGTKLNGSSWLHGIQYVISKALLPSQLWGLLSWAALASQVSMGQAALLISLPSAVTGSHVAPVLAQDKLLCDKHGSHSGLNVPRQGQLSVCAENCLLALFSGRSPH